MMHLEGLKQAVKELASKNKYHSVTHRIIEHHDGEVVHKWTAYIADIGWTREHATPESVLRELKEILTHLD